DRLLDGFAGSQMVSTWSPVAVRPLAEGEASERLPVLRRHSRVQRPGCRSARGLARGTGGAASALVVARRVLRFHVTRLSDAFDEERSRIARFGDGRIVDIDKFLFAADKVGSETIFKLVQLPEAYELVTDAFVARVRDRGLQGFVVRMVW